MPTTTVPIPARDGRQTGRGRGRDAGLRRAGALLAPRLCTGALWLILLLVLFIPTAAFLVLAVSPRLFGQGQAWFTAANIKAALTGVTARGMIDSLLVSVAAAVAATGIAVSVSWLVLRSTLPGRRAWTLGMWAILIVPTYIIGVGWLQVLGPEGLLHAAGLPTAWLRQAFFGPLGVTAVLAFRGVPFAYFAISVAFAGMGRDFEDAARTHGGGRITALRTVLPILAPALLSALVIVFAESVGDFGVASTIAVTANFPVASYQVYASLASFPADFGVAAVVGWLLVLSVAAALVVQARVTRGRSYAVLGGRTRSAQPRPLPAWGAAAAGAWVWGFFAVALGVPVLGALTSSFLPPGAQLRPASLTLAYYRQALSSAGLGGSIWFSLRMALVCGTCAVALAAVVARLISSPRAGAAGRLLDLTLLAALAIPGVVFGAGYIFAYNQPFLSRIGIGLYGTPLLLGLAYLAVALPTSARVLSGPMSQLQTSLLAAARVHGASGAAAWARVAVPLLAQSLVWAWLLAFAGIFLELPISEMLAPAGVTPVAVAITTALGSAQLVQGAALSVVAMTVALAVIAIVLTAYRLAAPAGWRRMGGRLS
jgi:iron(III) transport system permease protein